MALNAQIQIKYINETTNLPVSLGKYCGATAQSQTGDGLYPPAELHTPTNHVQIRFYSDSSVQKEGFALRFVKGRQ